MQSRCGAPPRRAAALACAGLVVALGLAGPAAAPGQEDAVPVLLEVSPEERIVEALEAASRAYREHDPHRALVWAQLASALLEDEAAAAGAEGRWPTSNAPQLLDALHLYQLFARGSSSELDAACDEMAGILQVVERINGSPRKPDTFGSVDLDYHLIHNLVTKVGETRIDYHLITWQIDKIGDRRIDYNLITRMPQRIGPIEFRYHAGSGQIESVAGVPVD